jgi:hypothetical protein
MAYEDRILRMVRQKESAPFNDAKDRFRARTKRQRFPGRFPRRALQKQDRGLGSFENQMMMDQLRGPAGMDTPPSTQKKRFLNMITLPGGSPDQEFFDTYGVPMRGNIELDTGDGEKIYGLGDRLTKDIMLDSNNLRNFGLGKPPGTPIVTNADGIPVGYEETFTDTLARPSSLFGGEDTTTGDPAYAAQLENVNNPEFINKYNMFNPRQEGLDYTAPSLEEFNKLRERPRWDNPIGNFFRKFNPFNRGGIASLRR